MRCNVRVFRGRHSAIGQRYIAVLRVILKPSPLLRKSRIRAVHIVGLTGTEGEEILYGTVRRIVGKVMRIGHDDRLSVPIKPQVLVFPFAIKAFVEMAQRGERMVAESEGKHKGNLWYIHTILLRLIPCIKQRVCTGVPCKGAVSTVKEHTVHLGVSQHFGMLSQYPCVRGAIIAQKGFSPKIVSRSLLRPGGMVCVLHSFGITADYLRIVLYFRSRRIVTFVPRPVEHEHLLVCLHTVVSAHRTAKRIRCSPLVALCAGMLRIA